MAQEADAVAEKIAAFQVTSTIAAKANMVDDRHKREVIGAAAEDPNNVDFVSAQDGDKAATRFDKEANYTVHSLTRWLSQISSDDIQRKVVPEKRASFAETVERLRPESKDLVELIQKEASHLVQGVCHNDLLSANIMRHKEQRMLKIIDFDYTKKNFLLFDIANHFNEYTGLECDYERYFPSDAHMTNFVRLYRRHMREHLDDAKVKAKEDKDTFRVFDNEEIFYTDSEAEEEKIVHHWTSLVKFMTLCSHASWSIWSLFQEAVSNIDVDFLDYAKLRLARYMEAKDEIKGLLSSID
ncbi:ethanolamine kinase [Strigomonas culicis]|uniref:ethanolamine kinase n=1 Tax=Strigomonas culicis TaxID=28005 RepID=S9VN95_9TRYP|nr:ethanolamine kinase [Strigomonas culicis]|eukprot:EPY24705.1 ethanolamine kinase [Strigomonas culicis]